MHDSRHRGGLGRGAPGAQAGRAIPVNGAWAVSRAAGSSLAASADADVAPLRRRLSFDRNAEALLNEAGFVLEDVEKGYLGPLKVMTYMYVGRALSEAARAL
jgi:hypothetical protein